MSLRQLLMGTDAEAMRTYCINRFGVDPHKYGFSFVGFKQVKSFPYIFDEGNLIYIKSRLAERGAFKPCGLHEDDAQTARLHVFFLTLDETPEMLSRLPEGTPIASQVARSKISKTPLKISPIYLTAQTVSQFPIGNDGAGRVG